MPPWHKTFTFWIPFWAFARHHYTLSAIRLTSLFVQSTNLAFVGCSAFFTLRLADFFTFRRL